MARYSLALLLLLFYHTALHAQKRTVSGHVINEESKEPMPGVTVTLKGTTQSVVTDAKGYFAINPPARMKQVTLTFSSVGFNSREMKLTNDGPVSVPMTINHKSMDDVIVVGYGTQKRSNVLGAVSVVSGKELEDEYQQASKAYTARRNAENQWRMAILLGIPGTAFYDTGRSSTLFKELTNEEFHQPPELNDAAYVMYSLLNAQNQLDKKLSTATDRLNESQSANKKMQEQLDALKAIESTLYQRNKAEENPKP